MSVNCLGGVSLEAESTVAGQLGLKSSRPLSQLGPGSTRPESTRPSVFSERSVTYMVYGLFCTCIIFQTKSKINIKQLWINLSIKLLIDRIGGEVVI